MANKHTKSTYERLSQDEDYSNKSLDSYLRPKHTDNEKSLRPHHKPSKDRDYD